jgi:signal transduction histidine kinase
MNRLWVRFSLIIGGVALFVALSPSLARLFLFPIFGPLGFADLRDSFPELVASLPPETFQRLREAAMAEVLTSVTGLVVGGAVAALLVGVWLSRSMTAPLRQLETAANTLKTRDFTPRVPVRGSQELVAVATAFNEMAEQLQQAETLRRNLLADVTHELRHPLHILQGNLQAILDDVYPLSKEEIARLVDQTHHLTAMVKDLHELAQAEARQLPLDKQPTDMADLVKETTADFKPFAASKQIQLKVELLGALPVTSGVDPARIRQVVHNLLDNALRHTPQGGVITVQVEQVAAGLQVTVQDNGDGIAPEQVGHVFDRFYRTDSGRSRNHSGAGLGLAIVKAIVEAHDGEIGVRSEGLGKGSTFVFWLPV